MYLICMVWGCHLQSPWRCQAWSWARWSTLLFGFSQAWIWQRMLSWAFGLVNLVCSWTLLCLQPAGSASSWPWHSGIRENIEQTFRLQQFPLHVMYTSQLVFMLCASDGQVKGAASILQNIKSWLLCLSLIIKKKEKKFQIIYLFFNVKDIFISSLSKAEILI